MPLGPSRTKKQKKCPEAELSPTRGGCVQFLLTALERAGNA